MSKEDLKLSADSAVSAVSVEPFKAGNILEAKRHPDFDYIYGEFKRLFKEDGEQRYKDFLNKYGLDESKPYSLPQESFAWAQNAFQAVKEDPDFKYYKTEVLMATKSLNNNIYSEKEIERGGRTLINKPVNLNHTSNILKDVSIPDAEPEDGVLEAVLKTDKNGETSKNIDSGNYVAVSVEVEPRSTILKPEGAELTGIIFSGLAILDKKTLPGVPMTTIKPIERVIKEFYAKQTMEKEIKPTEQKEAEWDTAYINNLPDSSFAYIEPGGDKDSDGKTTPRSLRHLPYKDSDGKVDLPHLRNALARVDQATSIPASARASAKAVLTKAAKANLPSYQESNIAYMLAQEDDALITEKVENYIKSLREEIKSTYELLETLKKENSLFETETKKRLDDKIGCLDKKIIGLETETEKLKNRKAYILSSE